ncbi:hypothetical protein PVAND_013450 [Polypedilum vanderplanki]|uniref:Transporter n=1 Tax=Polypedilum vanderplanki TaxID=319348 RepID=A0A9J6CRL4_POLVA|nr:hypothetical protein PVAND_013450 [Polypedilum vanderplanki]
MTSNSNAAHDATKGAGVIVGGGVLRNANNGQHEMAPLNTRARGDGHHGVTIVLSPPQRRSISSLSAPGGDDPTRAAWSGKMQFFLSIIGYSVGLGNIWRFPYLCQQNGGGAFLIPFAIMLVLEGIPLFLIELGMGQRMRLGALGVWNTIHPWLGGIGISSCIVTLFVAIYYNVIITWCIYYFINSFRYPLPWAECPKTGPNQTSVHECLMSSETEFFWYRDTLDASPSMDDNGGFKWWIIACLIIAWIVVFLIVMKGIQSSGKAVYFTSLFPYIVLTIFFIRGVTLPGAGAGLIHMYKPKVEKLFEVSVWLDAATQVFYSFGLAFGSLIAFGSYNTPKNNCVRDVLLVSLCNAITAIYASVVIFAILGFKATKNVERCFDNNRAILFEHNFTNMSTASDEAVNDFVKYLSSTNYTEVKNWELTTCSLEEQLSQAAEGTGLAFIVFTQAIVELPGSSFWAVLFFTMLLALGLGSQIGMLEGMLCTIFDIDIFKRVRKPILTGILCGFCFIVGLIFCTGAGEYWLKMFDSFAGTLGLVVVAFMEMVAVVYVYGHKKFTEDIYQMTGYRPGLYWQLTWRYIGPGLMAFLLGASIWGYVKEVPKYKAWDIETAKAIDQHYPNWVMAIALAMIFAGILPMPLVYLLRRFQILKVDLDIHQGSIRRNETTASTKEMIDQDDDDDDDFGNGKTRIDGPVATSDSEDNIDDDEPMTMTSKNNNLNSNNNNNLKIYYNNHQNSSKKPFKMEIVDF